MNCREPTLAESIAFITSGLMLTAFLCSTFLLSGFRHLGDGSFAPRDSAAAAISSSANPRAAPTPILVSLEILAAKHFPDSSSLMGRTSYQEITVESFPAKTGNYICRTFAMVGDGSARFVGEGDGLSRLRADDDVAVGFAEFADSIANGSWHAACNPVPGRIGSGTELHVSTSCSSTPTSIPKLSKPAGTPRLAGPSDELCFQPRQQNFADAIVGGTARWRRTKVTSTGHDFHRGNSRARYMGQGGFALTATIVGGAGNLMLSGRMMKHPMDVRAVSGSTTSFKTASDMNLSACDAFVCKSAACFGSGGLSNLVLPGCLYLDAARRW